MRSLNTKWTFFVATVLLCLISTTLLMGTSTVKMNLAELVNRSGRIFVGKCISISESTIPAPGGGQLPVTIYTFSVAKSIKGVSSQTITVRQLGYRRPRFEKGYVFSIPGIPSYKVGEEFVLLLTQESQLGLTVPVGMAQGSFKIYHDQRTGKKKVVNGLVNAGLFNGMESGNFKSYTRLNSKEVTLLARKEGAIEYEAFVSLLRKLAR